MILPSAYLGNIEYYCQFLDAPEVVIDVHEFFQKQTYRSRCEIVGANGKQTLSVPVIRPNGKDSKMFEVEISNVENWRKDHLKAIESAYARTPYYEYYIDKLQLIFEKEFKLLIELNAALNGFMIQKLGLLATTKYSDVSSPLQKEDFRKDFDSKRKTTFETCRYIQPFEERHGFIPNLGILDLLFNEGPNAISILQASK